MLYLTGKYYKIFLNFSFFNIKSLNKSESPKIFWGCKWLIVCQNKKTHLVLGLDNHEVDHHRF